MKGLRKKEADDERGGTYLGACTRHAVHVTDPMFNCEGVGVIVTVFAEKLRGPRRRPARLAGPVGLESLTFPLCKHLRSLSYTTLLTNNKKFIVL